MKAQFSRFQIPFSIPGRRARRVISFGMTLVAALVFAWMIASNWDSLQALEWQLRPFPLLASFSFYALYAGLGAFTWGIMIRAMGSPAKQRVNLRIYILSMAANRLPIPLGHVAGRLALYDERTSRVLLSFVSALELALLVVAGLCMALIFYPPAQDLLPIWQTLLVLGLGLAAVHPRLIAWGLKLLKAPAPKPVQYRHTLAWFSLFGAVWAAGGAALYFLTSTVYPLPLDLLPAMIGVWSISGILAIMMVFLPVGLGLRELTLGVLLAGFLPPGIAAVVAILSRLVFTFFELLLAGLVYWIKE